jgi:uncharacterized Tic20 family protein
MTENDTDTGREVTNMANNEQRNIAMLTHLGGIILGFIPSLLVYLIKTDDATIREHAKEALNFQITVAIAFAACWVLAFILIGVLLIPILWVVNLIFCIIAAVKTSQGDFYRYPVAIRLLQ